MLNVKVIVNGDQFNKGNFQFVPATVLDTFFSIYVNSIQYHHFCDFLFFYVPTHTRTESNVLTDTYVHRLHTHTRTHICIMQRT
jgi:hypothetical protein